MDLTCLSCGRVGSQDFPLVALARCESCDSIWSTCKEHSANITLPFIDDKSGCDFCRATSFNLEMDLWTNRKTLDGNQELILALDLRRPIEQLVQQIKSLTKGFRYIGYLNAVIYGLHGAFVIQVHGPEKPIDDYSDYDELGNGKVMNTGYLMRIYKSPSTLTDRKRWLFDSGELNNYCGTAAFLNSKFHYWDGLSKDKMIRHLCISASSLHDLGHLSPDTYETPYPILINSSSMGHNPVASVSNWVCLNCKIQNEIHNIRCQGCGTNLSRNRAGQSRRISAKVKRAVMKRDDGMCVDCGSTENIEFDHDIPHKIGGSASVDNIRLLCRDCNRAKGTKIQ